MTKSGILAIESSALAIWLSRNKSALTNVITLLCIAVGFFTPVYGEIIRDAGFYAFSGAITNWLAVHMLFEKVPFLYGSGVIPTRFEAFKAAIKQLMMSQFFSPSQLQAFMQDSLPALHLDQHIQTIDYDAIFAELVDAILSSPLGGMVSMLGGASALDPLKPAMVERLQRIATELLAGVANTLDRNPDPAGYQDLHQTIERIVDLRLQELTPQMVKHMVQAMIQQHLGWLVVWGGIFGGMIGMGVHIVENIWS